MKLKLYAIEDRKAQQFNSVMTELNEMTILRTLRNIVNGQDKHLYASNPEDFALFLVGEYDTETGQIDTMKARVCNLDALKE